ncbi:MAG: NAD(P)/FAD-dependent oxidoreductase [Methanosarcinales archaeon]|nr:NAD(P)/FAD-dependent oxidoreductase [Methanosarcinales archaeon]
MSEIIIIGGGLAGLAAAYRLLDEHNVTVVEKDDELGGMAQSYHVGDYHIEKYYHHFFSSDAELKELIAELGLSGRVQWVKGTTGYYWGGKAYPMNTPLEILKFPPMSLLDIFRLGLLVMRTKLVKDVRSYDNITAGEWILKTAGKGVFNNFFQPLLNSKFGSSAAVVSAAWLVGRVKIRSNRGAEGERLGYIRDGFQLLVTALAESIEQKGGRIITGNGAEQILQEGGRVSGVKLSAGTLSCDAVISTVPPMTLASMVAPDALDIDPTAIHYQGTCCALLGMSKPLMTDGTYWLNVKADVPFGALIEHTNFMPMSDYGGEHLLYIASYFQDREDPLYALSEDEVMKMFLDGLERMYPEFDRSAVNWWELGRDAQTAPVYETGYAGRILPYKTNIEGLYLAGMFSEANYPERSMNGSIKAGYEAADAVKLDD